MKMFLKSPFILLICTLLLLISCQKESKELIDETTEEETISFDSVLTKMLISASQNNGYLDNILDGSGCTSIALPVTVIANEKEITINSKEDYAQIVTIFDSLPNDIDTLEFVFPISVVFEDFNVIEVGSQPTLETIIAACQNIIEDTYTCVDFQYPIDCFVYNSSSEDTGLITLTNDFEWFAYLNYLDPDIFIAIKYPMGVVVDNETTVVQNNTQLEVQLNQSNCDLSGGTINPKQFVNKLTAGAWFINLFDENGVDGTCDYSEYMFQFNPDGSATASSIADSRSGSWVLENNDDLIELILEFESTGSNDPFDTISKDWEVLQSTTQTIKLTDNSSGGGVDSLYFGRETPLNCSAGNGQELIDILLMGQWFVESYLDNGTNETTTYDPYSFIFESGGVVVATNTIYTYYGTWNVSGTDNLNLLLDFGNQIPLSEFNINWEVFMFTQNRVELEYMDGGNSGRLVFEML